MRSACNRSLTCSPHLASRKLNVHDPPGRLPQLAQPLTVVVVSGTLPLHFLKLPTFARIMICSCSEPGGYLFSPPSGRPSRCNIQRLKVISSTFHFGSTYIPLYSRRISSCLWHGLSLPKPGIPYFHLGASHEQVPAGKRKLVGQVSCSPGWLL